MEHKRNESIKDAVCKVSRLIINILNMSLDTSVFTMCPYLKSSCYSSLICLVSLCKVSVYVFLSLKLAPPPPGTDENGPTVFVKCSKLILIEVRFGGGEVKACGCFLHVFIAIKNDKPLL